MVYITDVLQQGAGLAFLISTAFRHAHVDLVLRKLAAAGGGNTLSRALRAVGRIERTLFTLQWLSDPALRRHTPHFLMVSIHGDFSGDFRA